MAAAAPKAGGGKSPGKKSATSPVKKALAKVAPPSKRKPAAKQGTRRPGPSRPKYSRPGLARAEMVRAFGEMYITHRKDEWAGTPFILEAWQWLNIILPLYGTLNRQGKRKKRFALIGLPRWNGKSEIAALMVLFHLFVERVQGGEAYVVAADERQAGIVFATVKRMIMANKDLRAACDIYTKEIWVKETGCVFRTLPHSADAAQGFHPSLCIIDEVHVHRNANLINAMVSGSIGRAEPLIVCITTAGAKREGTLWELLKLWSKSPYAHVYWQAAPDDADPTDPKVWRAANPASWITDEMLQIQFDISPLWDFERYHLNRTPAGEGGVQAFTRVIWERNSGPPEIDPALPVVLALDAAPRRDRCALVIVQRHSDGTHHWQPFVWEPGRQMEYDDLGQIEEQVRVLCGEFYVMRVVCDPAFLWLALNRLKAEGYPVETMKQDNAHMCGVAGTLYKLLSGGMVRHGDDPYMTDDARNVAVLDRPPFGWRMGKLDEEEHIDTIVAAGMGSFILEAEFGDMFAGPPIITG